MQLVTVKATIKFQIYMLEDDVNLTDAINEIDYNLEDTTGEIDILDTELIDFEICEN